MLAPIENPPPLGRDCVRLHTDRSLGLVIFGVIVLGFILAPTLAWIGDANFPSDYDLVGAASMGSLVAIAIIVRGATGKWSSTDLPRVQLGTGLLHLSYKGKRVAYKLAELKDVVIVDRNIRVGRYYARHFLLVASNLPEPIYQSTDGARALARETVLRSHIVAAKLRELLSLPDDDNAFRGFDPMVRAREILDDDAKFTDAGLALLADDQEPIVRTRVATIRSERGASGTGRPGAA